MVEVNNQMIRYLGGKLWSKEQNGCKQPCNRIWTNNGMKSFIFFLLLIRPTVIQKNNQKQILDVAPRQCPPWGPCNSASTTGYISSSRERHADYRFSEPHRGVPDRPPILIIDFLTKLPTFLFFDHSQKFECISVRKRLFMNKGKGSDDLLDGDKECRLW